MNSLSLVLIVVAWFIFGYFVYAKFLERKIVKPNDNKKTPAHRYKGIDYKPSKKEFLFGHHFASIAGAGPIIGPILAVSYFGWLFTVLWIALGTILIGAIHDYLTLMISVRHGGKGIAKISQNIVGKKTFYIFSALLWLTLMLVITAFSVSAAQSLVEVPELVVPFFGITATALFLGLGVYRFKKNKILMSLLAFLLAIFFIYLGFRFPLLLPFSKSISQNIWIGILFLYAFLVSIIPVWLILQPRDYISSFGLFSFLLIGLIAIVLAHPEITAPAVVKSSFPLWPILFITVACGAVSGFHSLVASGTTSKQLDKESHGRFIGYGGMVAEGLVALLVVIFVTSGLKWGTSISGSLDFFSNALSEGWIVAFGRGFANVVNVAFPFINSSLLIVLGSLVVNLFILTSLDTSTRVGRLISSEAISKNNKLNNKIFLTFLIIIPAFLLAITNSYSTLWRLFGSSNQLIAAIVLLIISAYLIERKKPSVYTLIPGLFMVVTTLGALFYQIFSKQGYLFGDQKISLAIISGVLIIFALIVLWEVVVEIFKKRKK